MQLQMLLHRDDIIREHAPINRGVLWMWLDQTNGLITVDNNVSLILLKKIEPEILSGRWWVGRGGGEWRGEGVGWGWVATGRSALHSCFVVMLSLIQKVHQKHNYLVICIEHKKQHVFTQFLPTCVIVLAFIQNVFS